jgi:hypothetical protein
MRRALLFVALAGCASAGNVPDETTPRQAAIFQSPETGVLMADRPRAATAEIAATPEAVWYAVKRAYLDFDVPVTVDNPTAHQIGNSNFFKMHSFGGHPMAELVDCGNGMTGPKAATYRIYISLLTLVTPDGKGGTTLLTTFVPMGQDISGNSSDRIPCGTTGRLEQYFIQKVKASLGN